MNVSALPLPDLQIDSEVEKVLAEPAQNSEVVQLPAPNEVPILAPIWWTAFLINLRAGHGGAEAYRRACPGVPLSKSLCATKAFQLLRNVHFRTWLDRIENGAVDEIEEWKRKTVIRAERLRRKLDKTVESKDTHAPKDLKAIADTENVTDLMARRAFGLDDERGKVQVQVNVASIIAELNREAEDAPALSDKVISRFIGESNATEAIDVTPDSSQP